MLFSDIYDIMFLKGVVISMKYKLLLLHKFLSGLSEIASEEELSRLSVKYLEELTKEPQEEEALRILWEDACALGRELLLLKSSGSDAARARKLAALTAEEKAELAEVERIINENRFSYHFQPIVNTADGGIYSYEALMRPQSEMKLSPYHILKYAELTGRLNDIERATFLNVLERIERDKEAFKDRKVFINSIPKTKLELEEFRHVGRLLMKHSDTVVVELTENAELDENELNTLQERFRNMDVKLAIDDYGTGYSNVKNLLRYNPNYVKIDRMLLTEIQNSPQKRHFVREIIEFCHDNGIMALAEGVETSEELRAVILLGADLIQGFYTARPSAELVDAVPYEIRQEIKLCQQERQDGRDQQVYSADSRERVLLDRLVKDDYKCVLVGRDGAQDGEVAIVGAPSLNTDIHIEVAPGFRGKLILENVRLSNVKERPCIDLSENTDVELVVNGENKLDKGGIRVPEGARLTVRGDGELDLNITAVEFYGIGNDINSTHGELIFDMVGTVTINADGRTGVCIGSGMGGSITVTMGKYILNVNSDVGIGIGAFYADSSLDISGCDLSVDAYHSKGVAIGSMDNNADIRVSKSSVKVYMSGEELSALGTVGGSSADILISEANVLVNLSAYRCTCVGALNESTCIRVERASLRATAYGEKALSFGGFSGDTKVSLTDTDTSVKLKSETDKEKYLSPDIFTASGGRARFLVNGADLEVIN